MFFKNILSYSAVNFYAQLIRSAQELAIRFILLPEMMGLWSLVLVIQNFCLSFDSGILVASGRELSLLYGANQFEEAANYRRTSLVLHLLGKLLIGISVVVYGMYHYLYPFQLQFIAYAGAAVIIVTSGLGEAFIVFYQSAEQYIILSKKLFFYWSCYALLLFLGAYVGSVNGLIIAMVVSSLLQALLLMNSEGYRGKGIFKTELIKPILSFAIPFKIIEFPLSLAMVIDSMFVAKFFSLKVLAIYTTAKLMFNQAGQIPTWVGNVLMVRMAMLTGKGSKKDAIGAEMLINLIVMNLLVLPIVIGMMMLIAYWGVRVFLPLYADVLTVLPVLLISLYFQPRVTVIRNYWIINKKFWMLGISNLLCMVLMGSGFVFIYASHQFNLLNVSMVYAVSFALYFLFVIVFIGKEMWGWRVSSVFFVELLTALLMVIAAMKLSGLLPMGISQSVSMNSIVKSSSIFFITIVPLMLYGICRLNLIGYLKKILITKQEDKLLSMNR